MGAFSFFGNSHNLNLESDADLGETNTLTQRHNFRMMYSRHQANQVLKSLRLGIPPSGFRAWV